MKQAVLVVAAAVAVVAAVVFGISRVADVSPLDEETPEEEAEKASAWETEAAAAFGGVDLSEKVIDMMAGAREWLAGTRPTEQFSGELASLAGQLGDAHVRLRELREFPYDERVDDLYLDAAVLYRQTVAAYTAMVGTADPAARVQLDRLARRVRILGDRVFDRGRELVRPRLHERPRPDIDVRLPAEVPDWVQEGIAPGPPLEPTEPPAPPSGAEPRLRERERPRQPRADWARAVQALDLPPLGEGGAAALSDGAARLWALPDPDGDRERSARAALSLLVEAEADRASALGLADVGAKLFEVGNRLWGEAGLPDRA